MKTIIKTLIMLYVITGCVNLSITGQESSLGEMVTKKTDMYVFPAKDQSKDQMAKDEADCYKWAVKESGFDPLNPTKVAVEKVNTGPDGAAVGGAAKGAAVGAAIGAISGDAGKGAAIGAVTGAVGGRRASRMNKSRQQNANVNKAAQEEAALMNSFKKAFSVCLEAKGYTVK